MVSPDQSSHLQQTRMKQSDLDERVDGGRPPLAALICNLWTGALGCFVSAWTQTLSGEAEMDCNALRRDYKKSLFALAFSNPGSPAKPHELGSTPRQKP
jgi:hypothetical protein